MGTSQREGSKLEPDDLTININTVNRPEYLAACIDSLLETTPLGVSLQMVFNGTPTDVREKAIEQASAWEGPTNFVVLDEMLPVADSHNRALASIQTRLVNFMGDDDVVFGNRLPRLLDAFNKYEPTPVVVTSYAQRIAGDASRPNRGSFKELGPTTVAAWRKWHASGEPFELLWPGSVLDVAALRSIGGFETEFDLVFDTRIFCQMSFVGPVISVEDRQFGFRIHQGSLSSSNWHKQRERFRYLEASHRARVLGRDDVTFERFQAGEQTANRWETFRRQRSDDAKFKFRTGGEQWLAGNKLSGVRYGVGSFLSWPPSFFEKVGDQHLPD